MLGAVCSWACVGWPMVEMTTAEARVQGGKVRAVMGLARIKMDVRPREDAEEYVQALVNRCMDVYPRIDAETWQKQVLEDMDCGIPLADALRGAWVPLWVDANMNGDYGLWKPRGHAEALPSDEELGIEEVVR